MEVGIRLPAVHTMHDIGPFSAVAVLQAGIADEVNLSRFARGSHGIEWMHVRRACELVVVSGLPSSCAGARLNAVDPVVLDGFVGPEIQADLHRGRRPLKALAELDLAAVFLLPREPDLEKSGSRRAARRFYRYEGGPSPLACWRLHPGELDLLERCGLIVRSLTEREIVHSAAL